MSSNSYLNQAKAYQTFFDLETLESLCDGDRLFQQEIMEESITRIPEYLLNLRNSLSSLNKEEIIRYSIHLRGMTSVCAIKEIPQLCCLLESLVSQDDFHSAKRCYRNIEKYWVAAFEETNLAA
jgi:HPt (histidine-containing phosphotransfer) domain-containing protein